MQISQHYQSYAEKTYIIVTNDSLALIFIAKEREIEKVKEIKLKKSKNKEIQEGTLDEDKKNIRLAMYKSLSRYLMKELRQEKADLVLCAPEALKNEVFEMMHTDVQNIIKEVVPKNLASLELDQIIRILQEVR